MHARRESKSRQPKLRKRTGIQAKAEVLQRKTMEEKEDAVELGQCLIGRSLGMVGA